MIRAGLWQRLDRQSRKLSPFATTVLLAVLGAVPLFLPNYQPVAPALPLMAVYYWSIFRPDLLPRVAVFALGLLEDSLTGAPVGLNALVFLVVNWSVARQRRFFLGKPFAVMWWGFVLTAGAAAFANWFVASLLLGFMLAPAPALTQLLLTLALYPIVAWMLLRLHRAFLASP